jgi:hypothetical protein
MTDKKEPYYWSVVYHMTETRMPDYLVYLFNSSEEAINSIVEQQRSIGVEFGEGAIRNLTYQLLEEECPVQLDGSTMVALSKVRAPMAVIN